MSGVAPYSYTFKWVYRSGTTPPTAQFPCCSHGTVGDNDIPNEWIMVPGWLMGTGICHWVSVIKAKETVWAYTAPPYTWSYSCLDKNLQIPGAATGTFKPLVDLRVQYFVIPDRTTITLDIQHYKRQTFNGTNVYNNGFRFGSTTYRTGKLNCMEQFSVPVAMTEAAGNGPFPAFCSVLRDTFDNYATFTPTVTGP